MVKDVFQFDDYRRYLVSALDSDGARGRRSRLAEALRCQPAFVSRVLKGEADFSQEHGIVVNVFLGHRDEESEYFISLLDYARAGTKSLKEFHFLKILQMRAKRQMVSERIGVKKGLSQADQATYYSAWYFSAIHILLLAPGFRTPTRLAERLKLPVALIKDVLDFLLSVGLATTDENEYLPGLSRIHLQSDSPNISKHHLNWRVRAMQALDAKEPENLHYSGPICISKAVSIQIREMVLRLLSDAEPLIRGATDEEVYCLDIDFFKI